MEEEFRRTAGVISTAVGYAGGTTTNPTYRAVCSGKTGHAETVEVAFDPARVSYDQLIDVFWSVHNPHNPSSNKPGGQYRSVLFYRNADQLAKAKLAVIRKQKQTGEKVLTEIAPAPVFWRAEEYHQHYVQKQSCRLR